MNNCSRCRDTLNPEMNLILRNIGILSPKEALRWPSRLKQLEFVSPCPRSSPFTAVTFYGSGLGSAFFYKE